MEILNNIWSALSTENEGLLNLLLIPLTFFEDYISLLIFSTFLKISSSKKQKIFYIISIGIISIISMNFLPTPLNTLFNYIFLFVIIKILFKLNIIKTILAMILPISIFSVFGIFILNTIIKAFSIDFNLVNYVPIYRLLYLCILYFFVYILLSFFNKKDARVNILDNLSKRNRHIVTLNLTLGVFTLIIQLFITRFYIDRFPLYITALSSVSLVFYFVISFYSLNRVMKLQKTAIDLENAENYNRTLSFLYDNVKGFKHDFDDIVNMIGGYVRTNDMDGLKSYYKDLEADYEKVKNIATLNPDLINNPGIYNLLVTKYKKANEYGIKINLEYFFDFEKLHMPIYQFSRMLGILLDNAIEAASTSNEKQINVTFRDSQRNNTQIIIVENTYSNKDVDTKKIFEKGVTGKEEHMGMGLWEVHQIIRQNNNVHINTTNNDKFFKQQLEIYY